MSTERAGGLYQSVLRAELTHRLGVDWRPIVNGQAEIAGIPDGLLAVFSKRAADIERHWATSSTTSANRRAASRHGGNAPPDPWSIGR